MSPSFNSNPGSWKGTPFENPFPALINEEVLQKAEEEYSYHGRRKRYVQSFAPGNIPQEEYDLSANPEPEQDPKRREAQKKAQALLLEHLDYTGEKGKAISRRLLECLQKEMRNFKHGDEWARFRKEILPRILPVRISSAVSLGLGGLFHVRNKEDITKWITELACFLSIVEGIVGDSRISTLDLASIDQSGTTCKYAFANSGFEVVLQEPQFTSADAKLLKALGVRAVREPHGKKYIGGRTLLFGLHLPHDTIWNYAFSDDEPAVYIGDNVHFTSTKCIAEALVDARQKGDEEVMREVYSVANNAGAFVGGHKYEEIRLPEGSNAYKVFSNNISIWYPKTAGPKKQA